MVEDDVGTYVKSLTRSISDVGDADTVGCIKQRMVGGQRGFGLINVKSSTL
jgi:hypothetical protein